jgi:hypothetical protein
MRMESGICADFNGIGAVVTDSFPNNIANNF